MLRPFSNITFTKSDGTTVKLDFCNDIEIRTSYEDLTDTATIIIPRKLSFEGTSLFTGTSAIFRRKDKVKIELGYLAPLEGLKTVFEGYISFVNGTLPVEIKCEDEMFVLKSVTIKKYSTKSTKLKDLMKDILPSDIYASGDFLDVNLGSFAFSNVTVAQILERLRTDYGLYSYFVNKKLHVGLPSDASQTATQDYTFERTIIDSKSLIYQQKEDIALKVVAISMQSNNKKKEITVGDADGSQRTFHTYNTSDSDLTKFANLKLEALKYSGYNGSFETFGEPLINHGDIAELISTKMPERNGFYDVVSVTRKFGMKGYRQSIELGAFFGSSLDSAITAKAKLS